MTILARPEVVLSANTRPLDRALNRAAAAMQNAGRSMAGAGQGMRREMKGVEGGTKSLSTNLVNLGGVMRSAIAVFGGFKLAGMAKDAAVMAARYETLGVVVNVVGRNAGYSVAQMTAFEKGLRGSGIAAIEARESLARMTQAQVDLSHATDLARVAQDAAVIAGTNSSDAFSRLVYGIQSAQVETLRTMGLNVTFESSYAALAKQLGKNVNELTALEKTQARVNVVLEAGEQITGAYESSMTTAGKQLGSMKRLVDDLMVSLGSAVLPEFTRQVFAMSDGLKSAQQNISPVVEAVAMATSAAIAMWRTAVNVIQLTFGSAATAIFSVAEFAVRGLELMLDLANRIPGVNMKAIVSSEELRNVIAGTADAMWRDMVQIGDAWNDVLLTANRLVAAQHGLRFQPERPDKGPGAPDPDAPRDYAAAITELGARLNSVRVGAINPMTGALTTLDEMMARSSAARWADEVERAGAVVAATVTPLSQYNAHAADLDRWYSKNIINQEQFNAALEAARNTFLGVGEVIRSTLTPLEIYEQRMEQLRVLLAIIGESFRDTFESAAAAALEELHRLTEGMLTLESVAIDFAGAFADSIGEAVTGGIDAFRRFGEYVIKTLAQIAAKFVIFKALSAAFPGSAFVGALGKSFGFAGKVEARAYGGPVSAGMPYVVGERGPELFMPTQSGTIVPNHAMGGGGDIAAGALAALDSLPRVPMTPEAYALTDWSRRVFSTMVADGKARGVR